MRRRHGGGLGVSGIKSRRENGVNNLEKHADNGLRNLSRRYEQLERDPEWYVSNFRDLSSGLEGNDQLDRAFSSRKSTPICTP